MASIYLYSIFDQDVWHGGINRSMVKELREFRRNPSSMGVNVHVA